MPLCAYRSYGGDTATDVLSCCPEVRGQWSATKIQRCFRMMKAWREYKLYKEVKAIEYQLHQKHGRYWYESRVGSTGARLRESIGKNEVSRA